MNDEQIVQEYPADNVNSNDQEYTDGELEDDVEEVIDDSEEQSLPSLTYKIENGRIRAMTDERDAIMQAIQKILTTERFVFTIYDEQYGHDINDLIGKDMDYVYDDIERVIKEALRSDDRIDNVEIVSKNIVDKDSLEVAITADTIYGEVVFNLEVKT
ncbi:DUF2634 domain-containing protein [Leuconostoc carnosum]|uniref:DUF2634 domain-containing protein n=1 Tax=Leuconostoc TaxID=1243 RepID=UPI00123B9DAB|nr:DUF2634 domain-containing protein [Leuconostoc carnosum]KAA8371097.1 DUF2634 domain-containing protein [Leuconostoc carnosum]KAA8382738.1 DUF2634 domain-containing protein [Leuconostoc carnosum]